MRSPNSFQNAGFATVPLSKEVDKVLRVLNFRHVAFVTGCAVDYSSFSGEVNDKTFRSRTTVLV
jgi:hypothetical protein